MTTMKTINHFRSFLLKKGSNLNVGWSIFKWTAVGIRTKILVPLVVLMLLSALGSTIGFLISTSATRQSILSRQLDDEERRLVAALGQSQRDAQEAIRLLSEDHLLIRALLEEQPPEEADDSTRRYTNTSRQMVDRIVPVQTRFRLDQVIVRDTMNRTRVNIGPSRLESISVNGSDLLLPCSSTEQHLERFADAALLILCAPIADNPDTTLAHIYAIFDLEALLKRVKQDLELTADPFLIAGLPDPANMAAEQPARSMGPGAGTRNVQTREVPVELGDGQVRIGLRVSEQGADEIVNSGLSVTLVSSGLTLVVLLLVGVWLAQGFTRPILKLARVAEAVAQGDLSQRANLKYHDEIGRLGCSLDHATVTITSLLDQQAHAAGERQAILESIADGVLAVDMEGRIVVMNPAAAELLQQDAEQMLGQPLTAMKVTQDPILAVGLQQIVGQIQSELVDMDQSPTEEQISLGTRIVRLQSAPTLGGGGAQTGAVVVMQDVTRMVEADQSKSAFIATASHELRTPLTSLKGFVDILTRSRTDNLDEMQRMCVDTIKRQTDSVIQLVNDLLEMARLEQGSQRLERRWVSPIDAIEESLITLSSLIEKRAVNVEVKIDQELPSVWIDGLHLRRMLTNIISNAVKYVYSGGNVWIRAYELENPKLLPGPPHQLPWKHTEERSLVIEVEDNGVGIRESDQSKLFTRFFRSENPLSVEVGGTGLGLAITWSLVELHEGQIGFRSVEGEGSCFWMRFPLPNSEPLIQPEEVEKLEQPREMSFLER